MLCLKEVCYSLDQYMSEKPATILVIDDEVDLLRSITAYLEDSGFIAISAENGKAAIEIINQNKPDLILTDLHMPVLGGLEVLHTVTKELPDIPVIVISGAGQLNDAVESLRLGAWDYITKPIADLQALEHAIKKALERKRLLEQNRIYAQRLEHNLKILEEDQAAGRQVQVTLLPPQLVKFSNFEFRFKIIPSLELSGDFVEYFAIDDDNVAVYLADVSGHGASSAFLTILLKGMIAKYNFQYHSQQGTTILQPHKLMQAISNEFFTAKLGKYLTLVYGVLNIQTGSFTYGIAGHYPNPIRYLQNGTTQFLIGSGFPIGIMANVNYEEQTLQLLPGEHLVIFSDGVMEVFMHGENLTQKEAALLQVIQESAGDIAKIWRATGVTTTTNVAHPDDITILVISHNP